MSFNVHTVINRDSDLWKTLWAWPKIELHRHLEGSLRLTTLLEAAREFDIPLPAYALDQLRPHVQMTDEDESTAAAFMGKFNVLRQFYRSMEMIRRIAREAVEDAAADNVKYMELRFTPYALARQNSYSYEDVIAAVCEETARAEAALDIRVKLIVSVNRHESVEIAEAVMNAALSHPSGCAIAGMDLAGLETGHSARPFRALFERGKAAGLRLTVHAGEWSGPANVREAIEVIGAERIGHGVRSIEDSSVIQVVRERGVTLEVCPTSNLQTGVVARMEHHPLPDLIGLGVKTTINTDDPSLSNITLTDELALAYVGLGMSLETIKANILNAAQCAFLPESERDALVEQFRAGLAAAPMP